MFNTILLLVSPTHTAIEVSEKKCKKGVCLLICIDRLKDTRIRNETRKLYISLQNLYDMHGTSYVAIGKFKQDDTVEHKRTYLFVLFVCNVKQFIYNLTVVERLVLFT